MEPPLSPGAAQRAESADIVARGARNVAVTTTGRLATHVVLMVSAFAIPRALGAETYGRYAAALAVVQILMAGSTAGLAFVEMRFFAPLWRGTDRERALDLGSSIWVARLLLSLAAGVGAAVWLAGSRGLGFDVLTCMLAGLLCGSRSMLDATRSLFLSLGRAGPMIGFELARVALVLPTLLLAFAAGGLLGVFGALPAVHLALFVAAAVLLLRTAPLRVSRFRWSALAPHVSYSLASFVGAVAGIVQAQFAVYVVASWVASREAGYLAFAVQLFALLQGLFIAARRSLFPILSELAARGETARLGLWAGIMMRYSSAAVCLTAVGWGLLGAPLIDLTLTGAFLPAHECGLWMLAGVMLYCGGGSANSLHYIEERPRVASANLVLFATATIVGLTLVLWARPPEGAALRIAGVYAVAAGLFFVSAVVTLWRASGRVMPLARTLALMAPVGLAWPAAAWEADTSLRLIAFALFAAVYLGSSALLGLLPAGEMREIAARLRGRSA